MTANTFELFGLTNGHKLQEIFTSFLPLKKGRSLHRSTRVHVFERLHSYPPFNSSWRTFHVLI